MATLTLTPRYLDLLKPHRNRHEVFDTIVSGFAIRVTPPGHKSFTLYEGAQRASPRRPPAQMLLREVSLRRSVLSASPLTRPTAWLSRSGTTAFVVSFAA